jgi:hypothetical protein
MRSSTPGGPDEPAPSLADLAGRVDVPAAKLGVSIETARRAIWRSRASELLAVSEDSI